MSMNEQSIVGLYDYDGLYINLIILCLNEKSKCNRNPIYRITCDQLLQNQCEACSLMGEWLPEMEGLCLVTSWTTT